MQRLAAASDGNHVFVERPSDLAEIFDREFGDALSVSARDITITIECKLGFKPMRILGRDGSIDGDKVTLKLNQLQADNERYVVVELQAPEGAQRRRRRRRRRARRHTSTSTSGGSPARAEAKPSVRFSANAKEVEDGVNKPVMSQVTQQIATEKSEKAVELRDAGDIAGARKVLEDNADVHQAVARRVHVGRCAGAAGLGQRAQRAGEAEPRGGQQLDGDNWDRTRKTMRSDQHKAKVQQAY